MNEFSRRELLVGSLAALPALGGYSVLACVGGSAPPSPNRATRHRGALKSLGNVVPAPATEPNMTQVAIGCDVLIAGGGMAGVCAALAAARNGAKTVLVQDRSRLGGNASSEIKMHICGADCHGSRAGWREGGILEELRLDDATHNPHGAWELWDLLLYDKCVSEANLTLLLDTAVYSVATRNGHIEHVMARCDKTEHLYRITAEIYCDCTGDGRLALESGAEYRVGRESRAETGEELARDVADPRTQGSSILFTARQHTRPIPFTPPTWARKITSEQLRFRGVHSWEYGYWWIELGGEYDTIRDNELLRFELLRVVLGVWDYIKNSGAHPTSANWALETVGMIPGKRESRRIVGDHLLNQQEIEGGWKKFDDAVAIGGWGLDEHPPGGFDAPDERPYRSKPVAEPYNVPLGSLYSRDIANLMMAGRNISSTHVAFTSARVMATCSAIGQAVGTTAAYGAKHKTLPREVRNDLPRMRALQQALLRDDQTIRTVRNEDPDDLARTATVTASSSHPESRPENIIDGYTRDRPGQRLHRWIAADSDVIEPWIKLAWDQASAPAAGPDHVRQRLSPPTYAQRRFPCQSDRNPRPAARNRPRVHRFGADPRRSKTGAWTYHRQLSTIAPHSL